MREFIRSPPQTNEVRRAIALLPAFLAFAQRCEHGELDLLEIGASAGLNLGWDRFHYQTDSWTWGTPGGAEIDTVWHGPPPALEVAPRIVTRAGCDQNPLDIREDLRRMLASLGHPSSAVGVAGLLRDVATDLVIDDQDEALADEVGATGLRVHVLDTIMGGDPGRARLAGELLERSGAWDPAWQDSLEHQASERIESAVTWAEAVPEPTPEEMFGRMFAEPTPALVQQAREASGDA